MFYEIIDLLRASSILFLQTQIECFDTEQAVEQLAREVAAWQPCHQSLGEVWVAERRIWRILKSRIVQLSEDKTNRKLNSLQPKIYVDKVDFGLYFSV